MSGYSPRVDGVIDHCNGLDEVEFAVLAIAAADQAGMPMADLKKLGDLLAASCDWSDEDRALILETARPIVPTTEAQRAATRRAEDEALAERVERQSGGWSSRAFSDEETLP